MSWLRSFLVLGALLHVTACGGKDIGELCEAHAECDGDLCIHASSPAADGTKQCSQPCEDGCPEGAVCVNSSCMRGCAESASCPSGTACDPFFGACFASCSGDEDCTNNSCSARMLCDGA